MKRIEIGLEDIVRNIRKNKKGMLIIFFGIFFAGIVCGFIDVWFYKQEVYTPEDTMIEKVDFGHLEKDEKYYYLAYMELKEKSSGLNAYIQYLKQVDLSAESLKKVSELEMLAVKEQKKFTEISEFFSLKSPIIFDDSDAATRYIFQKIEIAQQKLDSLNSAEKKLEALGKEVGEKERTQKKYAEQEVRDWKNYLKISLAESQKINSEMDELLEEGRDSTNGLVEKFNELIRAIETKEQYEIVYNPYLLRGYCAAAGVAGELNINKEDIISTNKNKALIYARSIAGVDSHEERFYAILTFSLMLGAAFSLLYGGLKGIEGSKIENLG